MTKPSIAALLAKSASKKTPKKSDTPELDLHGSENITCSCGTVNDPSAGGWKCTSCDLPLSLVDQVYEAYQAHKDAEATFKSLEGQLLELVRPEYEAGAKGDFHKTYNLAGKETPGVQVSYKDMFKQIPLDKEPALRSRLGEMFDSYFRQARDISLIDTSDDGIEALLEKLGPDLFQKFFKVEMYIGTKPDLDRKQFQLPPEVQMVVQQYKAALKIRKED